MRLKPRIEKALLFLSDLARLGWVVVDAWAVRSGAVVFRTQSGQLPNRPEIVSLSHLAALLGLSPAVILRKLRTSSKPSPEPADATGLGQERAQTNSGPAAVLPHLFAALKPLVSHQCVERFRS